MQRSVVRWRAARNALVWRQWEDQLVVRNARSGSTHLLSPSGTRVLLALIRAEDGLEVAEMASQLFELDDGEAEEIAGLETLLAEFQKLGLAEPACT